MALIKNISTGDRGAYADGVLVMVPVGQTIEADDFCEEWFEVVEDDDGEPALAKMTVAQLKAYAEAEGIDLGDAEKKADIVSAIELAFEART
ncbi:MAG: hypothetical protein RLZZ475_2545 [Pseudomonadota bacterium]|jgi:hypothetical protein